AAAGVAAVIGPGVAVVALLGADGDAVTAAGGAADAAVRAGPPGLDLAGGGATIRGGDVPVVAGLVTADLAVAAHHGAAARLAGRRADVVRLDDAGRGAAVHADLVAVIALLAVGHGDLAVAADIDQ